MQKQIPQNVPSFAPSISFTILAKFETVIFIKPEQKRNEKRKEKKKSKKHHKKANTKIIVHKAPYAQNK